MSSYYRCSLKTFRSYQLEQRMCTNSGKSAEKGMEKATFLTIKVSTDSKTIFSSYVIKFLTR